MMTKKVLLFAPAAFNLAETTRMLEIAKGVVHHDLASKAFDIQFISDGGDFEYLIEEEGFPLQKLEPRLTVAEIEHIYKVDKGEKFAPAFEQKEMIEKIESEAAYIEHLNPIAVITGSYLTIPVTCRILQIPLVWVIQSARLEDFLKKEADMTDGFKFKPFKRIADWMVLMFINFWRRYGFLNPVNKAAKYFNLKGYKSIFEYWQGDITLVAEPAEFSGVKLPSNHYFTGPLIARQSNFPIFDEIINIPRDQPLVYFTMGSSGAPEIVAKIIESFKGKPYSVLAPVKFQLDKVPGVNIPSNVIVTDWLPAHLVNKLADLSVIHGGIGTVMTAAYAGKPVVGIGMQPEQVANIDCLVRKGFAIRVPKSKDPSPKIQAAIHYLLNNEEAKIKAEKFSKILEKWDGR